MVNPGGTGRPARVISATPAPLPPSRSRIDASPSSKRYTHWRAVRRLGRAPLAPAAPGLAGAARRVAAAAVADLPPGVVDARRARMSGAPVGMEGPRDCIWLLATARERSTRSRRGGRRPATAAGHGLGPDQSGRPT